MATDPTPLQDHALPVLTGAQGIDDSARADLYDIFHDSKDPEELTRHLQTMPVPEQVKTDLYEAKKRSMPVVPPVDKVTAALTEMAKLDPTVLSVAENHPNTLKAYIAAATTPDKEPGAGSGNSKSKSDSKTSSAKEPAAGEAAASTQPLPGGLPPVPRKHARVLASDGGIHDLPAENIERARAIDPGLTVMHMDQGE